jgi:hypothetical protein
MEMVGGKQEHSVCKQYGMRFFMNNTGVYSSKELLYQYVCISLVSLLYRFSICLSRQPIAESHWQVVVETVG